ncbi:MAG TPA: alpha-1,4-glucan--maltose-1-phosphate maltosyltransferase, partial [Acidimicrobiales bacterium]|nr:alpha-1,4-glucan--maltose-1-phosphate maltosyltransferase [Acidimicrobiales bacterium]
MAVGRPARARQASRELDGAAAPPLPAGPWLEVGDRPRAAAAPPRPVIGAVRPQVDGGRYPAKAAIGDFVAVEADVFVDGHDELSCVLLYAHAAERSWSRAPLRALGNDRWQGGFPVHALGDHHFVIQAAPDPFASWRRDLRARVAVHEDLSGELAVGAALLEEAAERAGATERALLLEAAGALRRAPGRLRAPVDASPLPGGDGTVGGLVFDELLAELVRRHPDPDQVTSSQTFAVRVEPELARFGTWYELFPRSASPDPSRPGTLADVEARLGYLAHLGIDVLYLPPIHPIGRTHRKGPDGAPTAGPDDPGSPWAIGADEGGHTAVHPDLGTLADFDRLVAAAAEHGIAVALDLAFQCSPDHPWVRQHPEWFRHRPDGSIRYAENPPKKYEDIYPFDFDTPAWRDLWLALLDVVRFWIDRGVKVFRVDNPHTKPFPFWEWLIREVKGEHPEVIFLAEAFTRPKVMQHLAKLGFSQSYTYFAWRSAKWELEQYFTELTRTEVADYFRPNLWPNTPDILTDELQFGGTPAFVARLVLAATLGASYGIYGPAFELGEHVAREAGSEEYRGSEKYAVRHWDLERPDSLAELVARVNRIRRDHPALHHDSTLRFHHVDNDQLIAYSKTHLVEEPRYLGPQPAHEPREPDVVVVVVNLDHHHVQSGWVDLDLGVLGLPPDGPYLMHDLLTDARFEWRGPHNFVRLDPAVVP